jgi:hypothetical protein
MTIDKLVVEDQIMGMRDLIEEWKDKQMDDDTFYYEIIGILNYLEEEIL